MDMVGRVFRQREQPMQNPKERLLCYVGKEQHGGF